MIDNATDLPTVSYCSAPDGTKLAFRHAPGTGPAIVFLPGYMSDMDGGKAQAVMRWAMERGSACILLDYSGCGQSMGRFADGTLTRWREDVLAVLDHARASDGPIVLVGSSMGGWLMLLVAQALRQRGNPAEVAAMVGIAPAPDFIEWGYDAEKRGTLAAGKIHHDRNQYGPEPTPTYPGFYADARSHLLLDRPIPVAGPLRLLHGQRDPDVPWEISLRLAGAVAGDNVHVHLIKDGDHRLSRDEDIAELLGLLAQLPVWSA